MKIADQHSIEIKDVSRETFDIVDHEWVHYRPELHNYATQLHWWNARINLISRNASMLVIEEHIKHSLLMAAFDEFYAGKNYLDIGSGGGLPSFPLAITESDLEFSALDIVEKKVTALKDMNRKLGLTNMEIINADITTYDWGDAFDVIISKHAFKMNELWPSIKNKKWNSILLLKGQDFVDELALISDPLHVKAYSLQTGTVKSFYAGKYFLEIKR